MIFFSIKFYRVWTTDPCVASILPYGGMRNKRRLREECIKALKRAIMVKNFEVVGDRFLCLNEHGETITVLIEEYSLI